MTFNCFLVEIFLLLLSSHFSQSFIDNHFDVLPFHIQDLIKLHAANYFLVFAFLMCKVSQNITTLLVSLLIMSKASQNYTTLLVSTPIMSKVSQNYTTLLVSTLIMSKVNQNYTTLLTTSHLLQPHQQKNRYPYQGYLPKLTSLYSLILFQSESVLLQSQLCPLP